MFEAVKKDELISPYIGRDYGDATEVLSMGLESLYLGKEQVFRIFDGKIITKSINDDIEYLNLIIGLIIKG